MKILITIVFVLLFSKVTSYGQNQIKKEYNLNLNFNDNTYVRILDGILLKENELVPSNLKFDKIIITKDSIRLKGIGIKYTGKSYMVLNSDLTPLRQYIYNKAKVSIEFKEINLPIIINGELITPAKYDVLEKTPKNLISKAYYLKTLPKGLKSQVKLPLGAVFVITE